MEVGDGWDMVVLQLFGFNKKPVISLTTLPSDQTKITYTILTENHPKIVSEEIKITSLEEILEIWLAAKLSYK